MKRRFFGAIAVIVGVFALVGGAGGVFAGEESQGPGQTAAPGELRKVEAEQVPIPRAGSAAPSALARAAKAKQRKPQLVYLETAPQSLAPGPTGFRVGDCPPRAKAINGYYFVNGTQTGFGLDNQGDSPFKGLRQWAFYLDGGTTGATNVTFGLICLKNVR